MAEPTKKSFKAAQTQDQERMGSRFHLLVDAADAITEAPGAAAVAAADKAPLEATTTATADEAPPEATTTVTARAGHGRLSQEDLAIVEENRVADSLRRHQGDDKDYSGSKSATDQRLTDVCKKDYKAAIAAVAKLRAPGRDPWTNFKQGLKDLASSIDNGAVLVLAFGEYVSKKISISFSVTDAPIRRPGSGTKKEKNAEVVPKSAGIGILTKKHRGKNYKPARC